MISHAIGRWIESWVSACDMPKDGTTRSPNRIHKWMTVLGHALGAGCFVASFGATLLPALAGWGLLESAVVFVMGQIAAQTMHGLGDALSRFVGTIHYLSLPFRGSSWSQWAEGTAYSPSGKKEEATA